MELVKKRLSRLSTLGKLETLNQMEFEYQVNETTDQIDELTQQERELNAELFDVRNFATVRVTRNKSVDLTQQLQSKAYTEQLTEKLITLSKQKRALHQELNQLLEQVKDSRTLEKSYERVQEKYTSLLASREATQERKELDDLILIAKNGEVSYG